MPNGRSRGRRRGRRPKRRSNEKGGRTVQTAAPALFAFMGSLSSSVGLSAWRWACAVPRCGSRCFRNGQRKAIIRTHRLSETGSDYIGLVRAMGLEPTRPYGHKHLKLACLPIPARSHAEHLAIITKCPCLSRGRRKNPRLAPRSFLCYNCSSTCPMGPSTVTAACAGPAPPLFTTASLCPR